MIDTELHLTTLIKKPIAQHNGVVKDHAVQTTEVVFLFLASPLNFPVALIYKNAQSIANDSH